MQKSGGVVHAFARCDNCGLEWNNYKNAQAVGASHAKKYGHIVRVDVGFSITYDGGK